MSFVSRLTDKARRMLIRELVGLLDLFAGHDDMYFQRYTGGTLIDEAMAGRKQIGKDRKYAYAE